MVGFYPSPSRQPARRRTALRGRRVFHREARASGGPAENQSPVSPPIAAAAGKWRVACEQPGVFGIDRSRRLAGRIAAQPGVVDGRADVRAGICRGCQNAHQRQRMRARACGAGKGQFRWHQCVPSRAAESPLCPLGKQAGRVRAAHQRMDGVDPEADTAAGVTIRPRRAGGRLPALAKKCR